MAVMEQLVFGHDADSGQRRRILGHSPGLVGDCAQEVVRLCEGWGAAPVVGLRRPVLLSFPLTARLVNMSGELHAVIRIAPGLKPIFHAVVLSRSDYQAFDLHPFLVAQSGIFLDAWDRDCRLERRTLDPGPMAAVLAVAPGPDDVGSVDEAVRQMMANQRLLLPLEQHGSDSDRFLALTICCLPRALRQDLRFASWAPSGTNRYSLAATHRDSTLFSSWQPYLMTTVLGEVGAEGEEYLTGLQRCLREGDLTGLVRYGAASRFAPGAAAAAARAKPTVSSVIKRGAAQLPGPPAERQTAVGQPDQDLAAKRSALGPIARQRRLRLHPHPHRRPGTNRARRGFAVLVSLALLAAAGHHVWQAAHRVGPADDLAVEPRLAADPERDVTDVAGYYRRVLDEVQSAGLLDVAMLDTDHRRRGLDRLAHAGEALAARSLDYLATTEASLAGDPAAPRPFPVSAEELHARGRELARELRLLALAQVSLHERIDWRDLPDLDADRIKARFDSLLVRRRSAGDVEQPLARTQSLVRSVDQRTRHLQAVRTLEVLLRQERWAPGWDELAETAVDALVGARRGHARQLSADALLLIRFKRAEHATGVGERAFLADYGIWAAMTPAVADIFPELLARVQPDHPGGEPPALLRATVDVYTTLARAAGADVPLEQLAAACAELARNRAVAFDPAIYADHVARLRFRWLEVLVADGVSFEALPSACYGGGPADEYHAFLALLAQERDPAVWRLQAERLSEPFLIRWARHLAQAGALTASAN